MIFTETELKGVFLVDLDRKEDERGFFARVWCRDEFERHGLSVQLAQCNISFNCHAGTLRGLHYQVPPHAETKLVRCTQGAIFDVVVDIRRGSPTFRQWVGVELTAGNRRSLYIPEGFAHGFVTLEAETEVFYQMSTSYHAASGRGLRYDDPLLNIEWPVTIRRVNERDQNYPLLQEEESSEFSFSPSTAPVV